MMRMDAPLASFVVPLFNTGGSLPLLMEAFRGLKLEGGWELVLVDDGSTDGTSERAKAALGTLPAKTTLVELARNFGEHAAVLEGYRHASGSFVVNLDDDLQNPVGEALRLIEHLRGTDAEVVYSHYDRKQHHWLRNLGSRLVNGLASLLTDKPGGLYLSSFRALRSELVQRIVSHRGPRPSIDGLILGSTNRIARLKVAHAERAEGRSGYTLRKLVALTSDQLFAFSTAPMRFAVLLGGLGGIAGLVMLVGGFLTASLALIAAAQWLMLGVLGEYMARAFLAVSGSPQSLVRSVTVHQPAS